MSDNSLIEWCTATWNFLIGCTKKSAGCMHCYAIRQAWRLMHNPNTKIAKKFEGTVAIDSKGELNWTGRINFDDEVIHKPLSWRLPRRVFVNSLSDLFHKNVWDEWIDMAFAVMALCPQHTFQILTKEPERMLNYMRRLQSVADEHAPKTVEKQFTPTQVLNLRMLAGSVMPGGIFGRAFDAPWPLPNVQLGVSVEDQKTADERIPLLLQTPAAERWISAEPLLGPLDLSHDTEIGPMTFLRRYELGSEIAEGIDWVVAGGESGPKARPMHPDWARSLRDQCVAAGVPFFFKQWGEWLPDEAMDVHSAEGLDQFVTCEMSGRKQHQWWKGDPRNAINTGTSYRIGKKAAGRLLDGREWNQFPEAKAVTA